MDVFSIFNKILNLMGLFSFFPIVILLAELALIASYISIVVNVRSIKREISKLNIQRNNFEYWEAEYEKHSLCNRKELALYALQEAIYFLVNESPAADKNNTYDEMLQKYGDIIKEYGAEFMKRPS
jgi:hypothetical protein